MRLIPFFLVIFLSLTACAAPVETTQTVPSPLASTIVPIEPSTTPESPVPTVKPTFENSLLAVKWTGRSEGNLLFPLDPVNGTALSGYSPISLGQTYSYAFSPDRQKLAAVVFPNDNAHDGSLLLIDLPVWKTQHFELKLNGWVRVMAFSPNGSRLAITYGDTTNQLVIFDLGQEKIIAQEQMDALITGLKYTASGKALMLYRPALQNYSTGEKMSEDPPQVLLLDAVDLSLYWSAELEGIREGIFPMEGNTMPDLSQPNTAMYLSPALVFAPDRDALYIIHADSDLLTTVDFNAKKVETVEIQTQLRWFERLLSLTAGVAHAKVWNGISRQAAISPDGQFLYVVGMNNTSFQDQQGEWQPSQSPLGLEIINTNDDSLVEHIETDSAELSLSPDGRYLYLRHWENQYTVPWTEIFDTSRRQIITRKAGIFASPALRMNGDPLLVSTYSRTENSHRMSIFQPNDLKVLTEWTGTDYIAWLTTP